MNGRETIFSILNYYNESKIDFDVYIVADAPVSYTHLTLPTIA